MVLDLRLVRIGCRETSNPSFFCVAKHIFTKHDEESYCYNKKHRNAFINIWHGLTRPKGLNIF